MMDELKRIADRLINQTGEPLGNETDRLHYWRDKAIAAANELLTRPTPSPDMVERVAMRVYNLRPTVVLDYPQCEAVARAAIAAMAVPAP